MPAPSPISEPPEANPETAPLPAYELRRLRLLYEELAIRAYVHGHARDALHWTEMRGRMQRQLLLRSIAGGRA